MTEYIEREASLKDFEACNAENPRWTPQRVKTLLLRQPTADVVPVRHGRWVDTDSEFAQCSLCKYPVYAAWNATNYCPNCGAKMDGGDGNSAMA